ncbi:MAG: class I SAM-dependent methyltransferase [Pseudorhodoplanes sp.]|nr:class I SAM-dependent methyltransferase [Pseudorhodoplanes sp.]
MSFSAQWLELRERYDTPARNPGVLDAVAAAFAGKPAISVTDLACGTGSTRRAIAARLPVRQDWRLVDNDLSLLARARPSTLPAGVTITTVPVDLARDLEAALDGSVDLVTASALLDLVSV